MDYIMLTSNIITFFSALLREMPELNNWYKMPLEKRKRTVEMLCLENNSFTDNQMTFKLT